MKVFHFRRYTLHLGRYELSRGTIVLPLPRIAMEILILLVERRGDLLTRQEIAARVWPGSDPEDVFQSINTAVNRIRSTLQDEAANPKYIQTVIGKGYRFVAEVEEMDLVEEAPAAPSPHRSALVPVEAEQLVAIGAGSQQSPSIPSPPAPAPQLQLETLPSPLPLAPAVVTSRSPATTIRPRWAAAILLLLAAVGAFALWQRFGDDRNEPRHAFNLVQLTANGADDPVTAAAISPDGKSVAYADPHGLKLRNLRGAARSLPTPPGLADVSRIEWFPDGRHIVVSATQTSTHTPQIWSISTASDAPRLIRDRAAHGIPSPDGSQVAFTTTNDTASTTFWVADSAGGNETKVNTAQEGNSYPVLLWSADARKLILQEVSPPTSVVPAGNSENARERVTHRLLVIDIQQHIETAAVDGVAFNAACLWGKSGILFAGNVNQSRYGAL